MDRQINLNEVTGFRLEESLRDRFPWASDLALNDALIDAAIMINSLIMAMDNGAEECALLVMAGERLEQAERRADANDEGMKEERRICGKICSALADLKYADTCCLAALHRAEKAIEFRNHPS